MAAALVMSTYVRKLDSLTQRPSSRVREKPRPAATQSEANPDRGE